ncbi:MAG TPA: phosphopyruvate hydratase [bacterium]|nr:phosphopyruvate hydratase [bacterium]
MSEIIEIKARQIIDSRATPTVEVDVRLTDGSSGRAAVPSGASTGAHEALELRDNDPAHFLGKGVLQAIHNIDSIIAPALKGMDAKQQKEIDETMLALDNTPNKSKLGANAILGVSMAALHAAAQSKGLHLYEHVAELFGTPKPIMPQVLFNVLNGGKHANWATDVQEYFIIPLSAAIPDYHERLRAGVEVYHHLGKILKEKKYTTSVGDEGGFAPKEMTSNTEPIDILLQAIEKAGYKAGTDIVLGFDAAASEFYRDGRYELKKENKTLTSGEWTEVIKGWCERYPIYSLEDMHAEDDWDGWKQLMDEIGSTHQIVGDDLLVTNPERIEKAIAAQAANSLLVKVNQIGSITETFTAIHLTQKNNWTNVFSHRSGETEDTTIADLVVGTAAGQIKTGAPARGERTAKYNQLLRIEEYLASNS